MMEQRIHYVHEKPASIHARVLDLMLMLMGMKTSIERKLKKKKFPQEAAGIPGAVRKKTSIEESEMLGRKLWILNPEENASGKVIIYFHGGAYISNMTTFHWMFLGELVKKSGCKIILPDYPLAPPATCKEVYDYIEEVYDQVLETTTPEQLVLMGDSAGGGLSLGLAQKLRNENRPQPSKIVLLSPWLDTTMTNPEIKKFDRKDKLLGIKGLQQAGIVYAGEMDPTNFQVSPIYGDSNDLGSISIFTSTHDLLHVDSIKLYEQLSDKKIPVNYFEYPGMAHDWFIFTWLPESMHTIEQLKDLIDS